MKQLIATLILAATALTSSAEEVTEIKMPFLECVSQAKILAKSGKGVQVVDMTLTSGMHIHFFNTKTHHVSIACMIISNENDIMAVTKETLAEFNAKNQKLDTEQKAKTKTLSKQLGL